LVGEPLGRSNAAPLVTGVSFDDRPTVLFFYKSTCPVCQLAAPAIETLETAYPGHIVGVGQDDPDTLVAFSGDHGMTFRSVSDAAPYPVSDLYGIRVVPTTFLVGGDGHIVDVVESWDRERLNSISGQIADLTASAFRPVSEPGDGLPPFRPG
jgi:peroxiredoxin